VWWGFEDEILYRIAKDEITRLAKTEKPFNFTMLTVDTHHVGGYVCGSCKNEYPEQLANVLACADSLVGDFVTWIQAQDFYENTVIVISGDHPRMDTILVDGIPSSERTVYDCFINSAAEVKGSETGRECNTLDMFPTVLAAMGFSIEGERLGLGTNLFSEKKTLSEELGYDELNAELGKYSEFYEKRFY
ncbi:MAG: sulfatase-like hydrolase/transferase, partial [Treponema sp.]|nr:sulfatase-like hydrolase/transferase [Treponema sp.]